MMHLGERVRVTYKQHDVRGWLEQADDNAVIVRLPSKENPEEPGDGLATFPCPPRTNVVHMVTCTSIHDHRGIMIGYLDPTWARTEDAARSFSTFVASLGGDEPSIEPRVKIMLAERKLSLAVPLRDAHIYNAFGRDTMREQAKRMAATQAEGAEGFRSALPFRTPAED